MLIRFAFLLENKAHMLIITLWTWEELVAYVNKNRKNMDPYKCKVMLFVLFSFHTMMPIAIQLAEELINIFYLRKCTGLFYTKKKEAVF